MWKAIAKLCATRIVRNALMAYASNRPFLHLGGYMHRWWLMPKWMLQKTKYGYYELAAWAPFGVRIHHIKREDLDPVLHDHPWHWRTIVLKGWYLEEDVFGVFIRRNAGTTRIASAETFHRIHTVSTGGVLTLFITGRKRQEWGFLVGNPARKVHHSQYRSPNDRGGEQPIKSTTRFTLKDLL